VLELANASYEGRLVAAPATPAARADEAAVVLFDTDGLGELGTVRYQGGASGWWPAGSLLSASLARESRMAGETVGLLTPYGPQAAATAEAVRDAELAAPSSVPLADVGTVASARGRSFDTVVLDLVEGPEREGWVRRGSWSAGGRWERSGARLFTAAAACAGRRLALIASGAVVREAGEESVLAPVRRLVEAGRVPVVSASSLLSRLDLPLISVRDEMDLFEAVGPHLAAAAHSIWIWAPWADDRLAHVVPLLCGAAGRGVRVTVFARAGEASMGKLDGEVEIVRVEDMRQKLVVIDDRLALLGCSSATERGDPGDVLAVHDGSRFARHVREQEHAELLGSPPRCGRCGGGVVARRSTPRGGVPWAWSCTSGGCGWTRSVTSGRDGRSGSTRASSRR
jgi:hypothetical protein